MDRFLLYFFSINLMNTDPNCNRKQKNIILLPQIFLFPVISITADKLQVATCDLRVVSVTDSCRLAEQLRTFNPSLHESVTVVSCYFKKINLRVTSYF